jgi:hypothetical protein
MGTDKPDIKTLSALTALNNMMERGHFNVCTIDSVAHLLGVNPKGEAYDTLRPLHCVDFAKMPCELREAIPGLIQQCLGVAPIFKFTTLDPALIELNPVARGFLKLIGRGN